MPKGKRISHLRSDSAFYQADVINWCLERKVGFTITADQDTAVVKAIATIDEESWKPLKTKDDIKTDREVTSTVHTMNESHEAFTLASQC